MLEDIVRALPRDVVLYVIVPFTYSPKPSDHMVDVRSFYYDLCTIESIYATQYNYKILLYDLSMFLGRVDTDIRIMDEDAAYSKCRRMLGTLSPRKRSAFINQYILEDL